MKGQGAVDAAVERFAARSHNAWRRQFQKTHPKEKNKPRMRMREGKLVDINKPWAALDPKAQADNKRAGYVAHEALMKYPNNREAAAAYVHRAWIKRNRGDVSLSKHLFKPYSQLSEEEKDKDRAHIDRMKEALAGARRPRAKTAPKAKAKSKPPTRRLEAAAKGRVRRLALDAATFQRLDAAAKRLSRSIGRSVSAEDLVVAGAQAILSILDSVTPAPKRKR